MKVKTDIRRLCDGLDEEYYGDLDVEPGADSEFDVERIRQLTFQKLHSEERGEKKENEMKMRRVSHKILIAAALIAVLTTTAFAAGGLDFFRSLFGDSVDQAGENIQQVGISASNESFEMTAEQLISDGFSTKVIVSLKPLDSQAKKLVKAEEKIFIAANVAGEEAGTGEAASGSLGISGIQRLSQFDTKEKTYYCVSYSDSLEYTGKSIELALKTDGAGSEDELTLTIDNPQSIDTRRIVTFDAAAGETEYPVSLTVNSISAVLMLQTPVGSTSTPTEDVVLVMKDKTKEAIFEAGWVSEGAGGGGGIALADDPAELPLASGYSYNRELETGLIVQTSDFSRILNTADVDYVLVGGERYDFQ